MGDPPDPPQPPDDDEPVPFEFTDELDLHAFSPRDARDLVQDYLDHASAQGWAVVRIIHGKGVGKQREMVLALAARHPGVRRVYPDERGGWGATVVELKPRGRERGVTGG